MGHIWWQFVAALHAGPSPVDGIVVAQAIAWIPIAMVASAVIQGVTSQRASSAATSAARASARAQNEGLDKNLAWEREQEERRRQEWERTEALNQSNWEREVAREQGNYDRNFNEEILRDRRREPYRVAGRAALADLDQRRVGSMADLTPTGRI